MVILYQCSDFMAAVMIKVRASVLFGEGRSPAIATLIQSVGRDRAAIIAYLIEQSWTAVVVVTALSPLLVWVLGATALLLPDSSPLRRSGCR